MHRTNAATPFGGFAGAARRTAGASQDEGVLGWIKTYLRQQRDYQRLLEMPDYLLKDIGLTRDEVIAAKRRSLF